MPVVTPKLASMPVSPISTKPLPEPMLTHHQWVLWYSTGNAQDIHPWYIHFPRYWPFVRGMHRWPVNSPHKGQWRGALMFSLICAWIDGHLSKQSWCWRFETSSRPWLRHCNETSPSQYTCQDIINCVVVNTWVNVTSLLLQMYLSKVTEEVWP